MIAVMTHPIRVLDIKAEAFLCQRAISIDAFYFLTHDNELIQLSCIPADYHEMIFSYSSVFLLLVQ